MSTKSSINKKDYKKTPLLNKEDDEDDDAIHRMSGPVSYVNEEERTVLPFPESDEHVQLANKTARFPKNIIITTRYTVLSFFPKSLFEQFRRLANVYFLVLGCIAAIGEATEYYDTAVEPAGLLIPLTIVVLISIAKDGIEDAKRNKADNRTNSRLTRVVLSDVSAVSSLSYAATESNLHKFITTVYINVMLAGLHSPDTVEEYSSGNGITPEE